MSFASADEDIKGKHKFSNVQPQPCLLGHWLPTTFHWQNLAEIPPTKPLSKQLRLPTCATKSMLSSQLKSVRYALSFKVQGQSDCVEQQFSHWMAGCRGSRGYLLGVKGLCCPDIVMCVCRKIGDPSNPKNCDHVFNDNCNYSNCM